MRFPGTLRRSTPIFLALLAAQPTGTDGALTGLAQVRAGTVRLNAGSQRTRAEPEHLRAGHAYNGA